MSEKEEKIEFETIKVHRQIPNPLKTSWDIVITEKGKGGILVSFADWEIIMGRLAGKTYAEIGDWIGSPPSTVQYHARRIGITKSQLKEREYPKA